MYAWMKDYSVANYFLFQMNPKLVLIINMQYYINFHGNKLGPAGDFLLQKKKGLSQIFLQGCLSKCRRTFGEVENKKMPLILRGLCFSLTHQTHFFSRSYDRLN